jgi:hypothetical protein
MHVLLLLHYFHNARWFWENHYYEIKSCEWCVVETFVQPDARFEAHHSESRAKIWDVWELSPRPLYAFIVWWKFTFTFIAASITSHCWDTNSAYYSHFLAHQMHSQRSLLCCNLIFYEGRLQSSWPHLIIPSRNFVEVRWRSLFRGTSIG